MWGRGLCDGKTEAPPETACLAARPICSRISERAPGMESSAQLCRKRKVQKGQKSIKTRICCSEGTSLAVQRLRLHFQCMGLPF